MRYFDQYEKTDSWHPLTYNERPMYALLASSASKISPVVLSELPISRHKKMGRGYTKDGQAGRLDLWINLNKNDSIIELKRVSVGLGRDNENSIPSKEFQNTWETVVSQARELAKTTKDWTDGKMILIGLLVVYGYSRSKKTQNTPKNDECDIYKSKLKSLIGNLKTKPSWQAYWIPKEKMRLHTGNEFYEVNPATAFIAYIVET